MTTLTPDPLHGWARATVLCAVLMAGLLMAVSAAADGIQVTIDRPEATIEDQLVLSVAIEGSQRVQPELPDLSAFEVYSRGSSRQFTSVNGRATRSVTYTYVLVPKRTGTFTIGAATAEVDGRTYESQPFQVKILEASAEPQESRDLFTRATVSTTRPYVGQQVIYTWRFYRRVRVGDARLEPQDFQNMLVEDLGEVREYQTTVEGQQFFVSEIRKAIFPQEDGTLEVPGSRLTCQVAVRSGRRRGLLGDFFGASETKVLRT
ncbi:MAG: BatD family protein, partial [Acidobacteriota bacterium]|nr:BatD family protein [Acidobacteriota bacterium]